MLTTIGTKMQGSAFAVNGVTNIPEKISTIFTCRRILADNLSRMPISIWQTSDTERKQLTRHRLYYLLRYKPNSYQNAQQFWSTVEYHRTSEFANAFVRIYSNTKTGYPTSLEIIEPQRIDSYKITGGMLYLRIRTADNSNQFDTVSYDDILHFRGISYDGVFGLSVMEAIEQESNIHERGTATINNFYKNNATSPMALETDAPGTLSGPAKQLITETTADFKNENVGPENAGKWIKLPAFTKAKALTLQFADAHILDTLKYTRPVISAAYSVPEFMTGGSIENIDIEQMSTYFMHFSIGPLVRIYRMELETKLLTRDELTIYGQSIEFDTSVLIEMDYNDKVTAIKDQTQNGLMTLNEGAVKLGNKTSGPNGDKHYVQAQMIPIEDYQNYSPLKKTDPTLKTKEQ